MNKQSTAIDIASDSIDALGVALERLSWLDSLAYTIQITIKSGHGFHAERLAGAVQYLSSDCHNMLNCEVKSLNERLEALEPRG